jgi:hypothetical protein
VKENEELKINKFRNILIFEMESSKPINYLVDMC